MELCDPSGILNFGVISFLAMFEESKVKLDCEKVFYRYCIWGFAHICNRFGLV